MGENYDELLAELEAIEGFEYEELMSVGERAAAAIRALRAAQRSHDRSCDSSYAAGMLAGWNYAQRNDDDGFNEHRLRLMVACGEDRRAQAAEESLRAAQQPAAPTVADDVARDAGRYRFLRAQQWDRSTLCCVTDPRRTVRLGTYCPSGELLDEQVDAMLAASAHARTVKVHPAYACPHCGSVGNHEQDDCPLLAKPEGR